MKFRCQITGNGISEGSKVQNFLGKHAPRPPYRGNSSADYNINSFFCYLSQ